jgi:hypothetical protein
MSQPPLLQAAKAQKWSEMEQKYGCHYLLQDSGITIDLDDQISLQRQRQAREPAAGFFALRFHVRRGA